MLQTNRRLRASSTLALKTPPKLFGIASHTRGGGVSTVISQVSSALSVLADYAYVKGLNPQDQLLAEDFDLAATLGLLSDVAAIASAASNVETNACLRAPAETTEQRANKEKAKVEG